MVLETPFATLTTFGRSHWFCQVCGFKSCGACLNAIVAARNASCPLVRRFPQAEMCVHVAVSNGCSPPTLKDVGADGDAARKAKNRVESLKIFEMDRMSIPQNSMERGRWQGYIDDPCNPICGILEKWTDLTPRMAMSPRPGPVLGKQAERRAVVSSAYTNLPKWPHLLVSSAETIFKIERRHRLTGCTTIGPMHSNLFRQCDKSWKQAHAGLKKDYENRFSVMEQRRKQEDEESARFAKMAAAGKAWRESPARKLQSNSAMKLYIRDKLLEMRDKEKHSEVAPKSAKQASRHLAGLWDGLTKKQQNFYSEKFEEEERLKAEEKTMAPKDKDIVLVQVSALCSSCGKPAGDGGAAVMPVSLLDQTGERLALVCAACQQTIDEAMASVSMAAPPRIIVERPLSKISPLVNTPRTAALFADLLSAGRTGRGSGPSACLYNDRAVPKNATETKFKLDYRRYSTQKGASSAFPARLLPDPFNMYANQRERKRAKNRGGAPSPKNTNTDHPRLVSEFSLRAASLSPALSEATYRNKLVQAGPNGNDDVPDIRPILRARAELVPRAVCEDAETRRREVKTSAKVSSHEDYVNKDPRSNDSESLPFAVQDIWSLVFSVRVLHRYPRLLLNMSTPIDKVEAEGRLCSVYTNTNIISERKLGSSLAAAGSPYLTDKHLLDLVAGAGVQAATAEALHELRLTVEELVGRETQIWKSHLTRNARLYGYVESPWPCLSLCGRTDPYSRLFHIKQGGEKELFETYGSPTEFQSLGAWLEGCGKGFSEYSREIINKKFMESSGEILPAQMQIEEQLFLHKGLRCLRVADRVLTAAYHKSEDIRAVRRGEPKHKSAGASFLIGSAGWWTESARLEKEAEDDLRRRFVQDRDDPALEQRDLMLVNVFSCFTTDSTNGEAIIPPPSEKEVRVIGGEVQATVLSPPSGLDGIVTAFTKDMLDKVRSQEIGLMGFVDRKSGWADETPFFAVIPAKKVTDDMYIPDFTPNSRYRGAPQNLRMRRVISTRVGRNNTDGSTLDEDRVTNDASTFMRNWDMLTKGVFKSVDWNNIFVAGGSVLRCLISPEEEIGSEVMAVAAGWGKSSDIDIFVYGLDEKAATRKAKSVLASIARAAGTKGDVFCTDHSVTLLGVDGAHPAIQFVLRCYKSPTEVLCGFDIDACCLGFDGETVLALPRCVRALRTRTILVDLDRRSLTYEKRLIKYSKRGFLIACGGFRQSDFDPVHLSRQPKWTLKGLGILLRAGTNSFDNVYHSISDLAQFQDELRKSAQNDKTQSLGLGEYGDYGFIPYWGGFVSQSALDELKKEGTTSFPLKDGSTAVLSNVCLDSVELDLTWVTQDPGRQIMTGSFHPVSGGDWGECHRWNRNHLPPPDTVHGSTGISTDPEFFKRGARSGNEANSQSSLKSLFSRRRFFYIYLLSVRARSIINTALFDTPNSFAAEAILPYLRSEDIGRFSMSTKWETGLPFPGRDVAELIRAQVEKSHENSVNPCLLAQLEQGSVTAVIAGHAQPVHNPVMDSINRVFASVVKASHTGKVECWQQNKFSVPVNSNEHGAASNSIENIRQDLDPFFPADTKSLLVGIVDELLFQCSFEVLRNKYAHSGKVSKSSLFIGYFFSNANAEVHSTRYQRDGKLPSGLEWHPKVRTQMPNVRKYLNTSSQRLGRYGGNNAKLRVGSADRVSFRQFEFSEHVLRAFYRQRAANMSILNKGVVYDICSDFVANDGDALLPGLYGVWETLIIRHTYFVEKILRQLFHVVIDIGPHHTPFMVKPAHVMRAISSDRVLWSVFSQNVFPLTGLLPRGLRSDSLQRSRTILSEGLRIASQWNEAQVRQLAKLDGRHREISRLVSEMQHALNVGYPADRLQKMTWCLREMFRELDLAPARNDNQVAAILNWTKDVETRLVQDKEPAHKEETLCSFSFSWQKKQNERIKTKPSVQAFHYISTAHVYELAAELRIRLPDDARACEPILSAVDEFILCAINEAKAIAQVANRGSLSGGDVCLTLTDIIASLRLIMSADETSQMRPVGFSKVCGKARPILEIWMSREIGGALMAGRPAQSNSSIRFNGDSTKQSVLGTEQLRSFGESKVRQPQEGKVERQTDVAPAFTFAKDPVLDFSFGPSETTKTDTSTFTFGVAQETKVADNAAGGEEANPKSQSADNSKLDANVSSSGGNVIENTFEFGCEAPSSNTFQFGQLTTTAQEKDASGEQPEMTVFTFGSGSSAATAKSPAEKKAPADPHEKTGFTFGGGADTIATQPSRKSDDTGSLNRTDVNSSKPPSLFKFSTTTQMETFAFTATSASLPEDDEATKDSEASDAERRTKDWNREEESGVHRTKRFHNAEPEAQVESPSEEDIIPKSYEEALSIALNSLSSDGSQQDAKMQQGQRDSFATQTSPPEPPPNWVDPHPFRRQSGHSEPDPAHSSINIHVVETSDIQEKIAARIKGVCFGKGVIDPIVCCVNRLVVRALLSCREISQERYVMAKGLQPSHDHFDSGDTVLATDISTVIMVSGLTPRIPAPPCALPPVRAAVKVARAMKSDSAAEMGWSGLYPRLSWSVGDLVTVKSLKSSPTQLRALLLSCNNMLAIAPIGDGKYVHRFFGEGDKDNTTKLLMESMGNEQTLRALVIDIMKQRLSHRVKLGEIDPTDVMAAAELMFLRRSPSGASIIGRSPDSIQPVNPICESIARVLDSENASDSQVLDWILELLQERFDSALTSRTGAPKPGLTFVEMMKHLGLGISQHFQKHHRMRMGFDGTDLFAALAQIPAEIFVPASPIPVLHKNKILRALAHLQQQCLGEWTNAILRPSPCRPSDMSHLFTRKFIAWSKQDWLELALYYLPPRGASIEDMFTTAFHSTLIITKNPGWSRNRVEKMLRLVLKKASESGSENGLLPRVEYRWGKWVLGCGEALPSTSHYWKEWESACDAFADARVEGASTKMVSFSSREIARTLGLDWNDPVVEKFITKNMTKLFDEGLVWKHPNVVTATSTSVLQYGGENHAGILPSKMKAMVDQVITGLVGKGKSQKNVDQKKVRRLLHRCGFKDAVAWAIENYKSDTANRLLAKPPTTVYCLIPSAITRDIDQHGGFSQRLQDEGLHKLLPIVDGTLLHLTLLHSHLSSLSAVDSMTRDAVSSSSSTTTSSTTSSTSSSRISPCTVTLDEIVALPGLLWPSRLCLEGHDDLYLHALRQAAHNIVRLLRNPVRSKPVRLSFKRRRVSLTEEAPTTSSSSSSSSTSSAPSQSFQARTYQDDVISSKFPHTAIFVGSGSSNEINNSSQRAKVADNRDTSPVRVRLDEWIELIAIVRSSLLFWRNNPAASLGDSVVKGTPRQVLNGSAGCLAILLNAAVLMSRKTLSRNTVVRLQDASKFDSTAERFLMAVFDITRVSRLSIPRSVLWKLIKKKLGRQTSNGSMTNPGTFVRAQALHQAIERQMMSCISLCARMADTSEQPSLSTTSTSTITGGNVRLVRMLLQKRSDDDAHDHLFMPRSFETDDLVVDANSAQTSAEGYGLASLMESKEQNHSEIWDTRQWELPAFMLFAEEQRRTTTHETPAASRTVTSSASPPQPDSRTVSALPDESFTKLTQRVTRAWDGLKYSERRKWKERAYLADKKMRSSLSAANLASREALIPPKESSSPASKNSSSSSSSPSSSSGAESKIERKEPAPAETWKEPSKKTTTAVLDEIYNLEGGRPKPKSPRRAPSRRVGPSFGDFGGPGLLMQMMSDLGFAPPGGHWCEDCQEYHYDH
jgi:hypothetical protein